MGGAQAGSGNDPNTPECVVNGPTKALTLLDRSEEETGWVTAHVQVDVHLFLAAHMMRRRLEGEDGVGAKHPRTGGVDVGPTEKRRASGLVPSNMLSR